MADAFAVHLTAGNGAYERGDLEEARQQFEHAVRLDPGSIQARYNLGVVYRDLELSESAWTEFIEVISRDGRMAGTTTIWPSSRNAWNSAPRPRPIIARRSP